MIQKLVKHSQSGIQSYKIIYYPIYTLQHLKASEDIISIDGPNI